MTGDLIFDRICKLWKLHSKDNELLYKVTNIYTADGKRDLYFISDLPHLLKTIRRELIGSI